MIVKTITDDYYFWNWLKKSDNYSTSFSLEGAKALQAYLDDLSGQTGDDQPIEFDPIAWCVEFTEYDNVTEAFLEQHGDYDDVKDQSQGNRTPEQQLEWFKDNTTVIELENGHIIIGEF